MAYHRNGICEEDLGKLAHEISTKINNGQIVNALFQVNNCKQERQAVTTRYGDRADTNHKNVIEQLLNFETKLSILNGMSEIPKVYIRYGPKGFTIVNDNTGYTMMGGKTNRKKTNCGKTNRGKTNRKKTNRKKNYK